MASIIDRKEKQQDVEHDRLQREWQLVTQPEHRASTPAEISQSRAEEDKAAKHIFATVGVEEADEQRDGIR